jgi:hypothetical protein
MKTKLKFITLIMLAAALPFTAYSQPGQLASVTTTPIAGNLTFTPNIAGTTAKGGGNVTDQGSSAVTERGLCWNMTGNPTISDAKASDGSGTGIFTNVSMVGLAVDHVYYVRAYAINSQGTAYGNVVTFNSGKPLGIEHAGGYVFYNNGSGGGLVSAKSDQGTNQVWSNITNVFLGTTGTAIGTGLTNTKSIVAQNGHTDSAAQVCLNYSDGIYSDWFLPSRDELHLMYRKLKEIGVGGFAHNGYWSSSEKSDYIDRAWLQHFYHRYHYFPYYYFHPKYNDYYVRAVRAF